MLNTERVTETTAAIELLQICKKFGKHEVLKDISLRVVPGETVCLLGPSGSGKSTLLRCINFLETADFGEIFIHGNRIEVGRTAGKQALSEAQLAKLRTRVSMVFQHFNLWPHMTVLENVIEAPIHVQKRPRLQVIAEAEELLAKVGLIEKRNVYPARLSGGQKQRVAIARALAMKSDVILFDEPTSSLDPELVGEVLSVMKQLAAEGMTMIIATHEMDFAREVANRVVFLDSGRIVETSDPKTFFSRPSTERARQFLERYNRGA